MSFNRALIFGSIVGIAGAALWAAIAYYGNVEIGWLAWGIGLAVGVACVKGAGYGSTLIGTSAAIITLLSIMLGRYATIALLLNDEFGNPEVVIQESIDNLNDETLKAYLAEGIIQGQAEDGKEIQWPEVDVESATIEETYPPEIWNSASEKWDALSPEERQEIRTSVEATIRENFGENFVAFQDEVRNQGFLHSFGLIDLVFFGLALYTAFSVGQSDALGEEAEGSDLDSDEAIPEVS